MSSSSASFLLTARDREILAALDRTPLTVKQALKLSQTFKRPFTSERRIRERLQTLTDAGLVRRFRYATAGYGVVSYYVLARSGFQLLHGERAVPPVKRAFAPVGLARQEHTRALSDFIVHTAVSVQRVGCSLSDFHRENAFQLEINGERMAPDCALQIVDWHGYPWNFLVELDNRSERIRSTKDTESIQRKIRLYEAYQDRCRHRFRVLVVTTGTSDRLARILSLSRTLTNNPARSLFYGTKLPAFLAERNPLRARCFFNHRGQRVSLLFPTATSSSKMQRNNKTNHL